MSGNVLHSLMRIPWSLVARYSALGALKNVPREDCRGVAPTRPASEARPPQCQRRSPVHRITQNTQTGAIAASQGSTRRTSFALRMVRHVRRAVLTFVVSSTAVEISLRVLTRALHDARTSILSLVESFQPRYHMSQF